ncbi:HRDC domain-containing protein [Flavobacterium sp. IMCC34852]|uniref:HRDC domain-containing protein n=1 Tax=Flavobacterium rivulicola TaxID=2732161 RepID=A0A7Y3R6R8_9FLAO|nr:HRDC domain-containing protein [Flavobacterium sp. IMCC34852]NNT70943.1 HRDC domain-containing protein [Flavobacterium sp. IMCC34852]
MNIKVFNIRLAKEFFQEDQAKMNAFLDSVEVKLASANFVTTGSVDFWSATVFYLPKKVKSTKPDKPTLAGELSSKENEIFNALRVWRNDLAQKLDRPSYTICHNSHLIAVAKSNPQTLEDLEGVSGFGKIRAEKYGEDILAVLNAL